jgi:hypothetical protein
MGHENFITHLLQHALKPLSLLFSVVRTLVHNLLCSRYIDLSMPGLEANELPHIFRIWEQLSNI